MADVEPAIISALSEELLKKVDMEQIPVISVNANGMETNEGFKMTPAMIIKAMQAVVYGDLFMRVLYATRPYEKEKGAANRTS